MARASLTELLVQVVRLRWKWSLWSAGSVHVAAWRLHPRRHTNRASLSLSLRSHSERGSLSIGHAQASTLPQSRVHHVGLYRSLSILSWMHRFAIWSWSGSTDALLLR